MIQTRIKRWTSVGVVLLAISALVWLRSQAQGGDLHYGDTINGTLKAGATDEWRFAGSTGDVIGLSVQRASGDLEPVLLVQDRAGQPVAGTQADKGQGSASLVQVRLAQADSYTVKVSGNGQTAGDYRLSLTLMASSAPTVTPEPTTATRVVAGTLNYGSIAHGTLDGKVFRQLWRFRGSFGDIIDINMVSTSGNLDAVVALISPTGEIIAMNDSASGGPSAGILAFQLPFTGEYIVVARRSGAADGQRGATTGQYDLSLALRGPGTAAQNTALTLGTAMQGRLKNEVPQAIYRLEVGGMIAAQLDLTSLHRLARVRFLNTAGTVLASFEGLSPLTVSTRLPDNGPFLVEVSSSGYDNHSFTDFSLTAFRLSADTTSARPLRYGVTSRSTTSSAEKWFFVGHVGDIISFGVAPDFVVDRTTVRVTGPQDVLLYQGELGPGLEQTLTLPDSGAYEVGVHPASATVSYETYVNQLGANGIAFGRFDLASDRGPLTLDTPINATLAAGGADAWWMDASAGQVVNLTATPSIGNASTGLALRRPDGSLVDVQVSQRNQSAVIHRALLDQTGRYHVVVFDSRGNVGGPYTLRYEELSGGNLRAGQTVKGIVLRDGGTASWNIDVTAGALINARLTTLTPKTWSPSLLIAGPDGTITGSTTPQGSGGNSLNLLGVEAPITGRYQIIVAGQVSATFASYDLISTVQVPFAADGSSIQVNTVTLPPVNRYAGQPPDGPAQLQAADLINRPMGDSKALISTAPPLNISSTVRGEIAQGVPGQAWRFTGLHDTTLQFQATSLVGPTGPTLTILDENGKIMAEQSHADEPTTVLTYRVSTSGSYMLVVQMGLDGGRYILSANAVNVVSGPLQVSPGKPLVYGQTVPGEILNGDTADNYYFLGSANDIISIQLTRAAGDLILGLQLLTAQGTVLASDLNPGHAPTIEAAAVRLPDTGLYTVIVQHGDKDASTTGRYFLFLGLDRAARPQKHGGGIVTAGVPVGGLLTQNEDGDTWLFQGRMGERVTFAASGLGNPSPAPLGLRLQDTAGRTFALQNTTLAQSVVRLANVMLPADGVYRVQVTGATQFPGAYTLTWELEHGRLIAGPLSYNQTVNGVFTAQHNTDAWTFAGTAGDVVSLSMRYERGDTFSGGFQLRAENGVPLVTKADLGDGSGARADNLLLPFSGSYTVTVANPDPNFKGASVYALTVNLQDSKARSLGGVLYYGDQGQGSLYPDDPTDTWVFEARAGDQVHLSALAQDQFLKPSLELRKPNGTLLAAALPGNDSASKHGEASIDKFIIDADGVYTVTITGGPNKTTGSYLLSLDLVPVPATEIETMRYGDTKEGLIASDRLRQSRAFYGLEGDSITARMTREPGSNLASVLELWTEDGRLMARADSTGQESATITNYSLPESGRYVLVSRRYLDVQGQTIGRYKINLIAIPIKQSIKGMVEYGQLTIGRLDDSTPEERIGFVGKAGDVIGIISHAKSGDLDTRLALENSGGIVLAEDDDPEGTNSTDAAITGILLPEDDTYTVAISRVGAGAVGSAGNYELFVNLLYQVKATAAPKALIAYGQRVVGTVDVRTADALYTFSGHQDDAIAVQLLHQTDDAPPLLYLQDPAGATLAAGKLGVGQTLIDGYQLPASGLYNILVRRPTNAQLSYSPFALILTLLSSPAGQVGQSSGGVLRLDDTVIGAFTPEQAVHYWLFEAKANQVIAVNLVQLNGDLTPSVVLIGPNAQGLVSAAVPERGQKVTIDHFALPSDGVYSLVVLPGGSNHTGQYRLSLQSNNSGPSAAALAPGQTVSGTVDAIQPDQRWSFDGKQGQSISAQMLVTGGNLAPRLLLAGPDGRVLVEGRMERAPQGVTSTIAAFVLPGTGSYTLIAGRAAGTSAGAYRLGLELGLLSPQAAAAQPIAYSQPIRKMIQQGTTDLWIFNGIAGDTVNITALANDIDKNDTNTKAPTLALQDAGGRTLAQVTPATQTETAIDSFTLPADGRYVVALQAQTTVSYTLLVQRRQNLLVDGITPRILTADKPLDSVIDAKDTADYWTFDGVAGRVVQITGTRLSGDLRLDLALYGPAGFIASATAGPDTSPVTLGPVRLPDDGAYILVLTHWLGPVGATTGRYSLTLTNPSGVSGSSGGFIPIYNQPVSGGIVASDDNDVWTFDGQAGDVINVRAGRLDGDLAPTLKLVSPDGQKEVAEASGDKGEALISRAILPVSGHYSVIVGRSGSTTGGYRLTIERVQTAIQASVTHAEGIAYGEQRDGELTDATPNSAWIFFGKAGDRVTVEAIPRSGSRLDPYLYILAPDGSVLATDDNAGGGTSARISNIALPGDGFYGIVVSNSPLAGADQQRGTFTVSVQQSQPGAAYQGRIAAGGFVDGTLTPDQPIQEWTFDTKEAQPIVVTIQSPSLTFNGTLSIVSSDGQLIAASAPARDGAASVDMTLPKPGQYAILVSARAQAARYRLSRNIAAPPSAGQ